MGIFGSSTTVKTVPGSKSVTIKSGYTIEVTIVVSTLYVMLYGMAEYSVLLMNAI